MGADPFGLAGGLVLDALVGELAHQLLLLGVHADHGLAVGDEARSGVVEVAELAVAIGMGGALLLLGRCLEAVAQPLEQSAHGVVGDAEALAHQVLGQVCRRLRRPPQQRHRVAPGLGMHQLVEASRRPGWISVSGLAPAPGSRRRDDGSMPASTSDCALITVLRLMPDAVATAVLPPWPSISDIAPATTRRWRSSRWDSATSKNRASPSRVTSTCSHYSARTIQRWALSPERGQVWWSPQ